MERKNAAHELVIESMTQALLQLMEKKPLDEISATELCDRAGVSRQSYYRNFSSKEEILSEYLTKCTDEWYRSLDIFDREDFHEVFWHELMKLYKGNEKLIRLIYKNKRSSIIRDHIFRCCAVEECENFWEKYRRAMLAGAICGVMDVWIKRGMQDFPVDFSLGALIRGKYKNDSMEALIRGKYEDSSENTHNETKAGGIQHA